MALLFRIIMGLFEHPFVNPEYARKLVRCRKHRELSYRAAAESFVLLKNENKVLPLQVKPCLKIAVIGPCAHPVHFSYYSVAPNIGVSIYEGVSKLAEKHGAQVSYAKGCGLTRQEFSMDTEVDATMMVEPELYTRKEEEEELHKAVKLAEESDIILVCVGGSASTSREAIYRNNSSGDNDTLELIGQQRELLKRLHAVGKPMAAVSVGGKPFGSQELYELPDAVIQCFYAGQETGSALAAVLFGEEEPSGRFPVTVPYGAGQLPMYYSQRESGLMKGYLLGAKKARFPFGYGLGYTQFRIYDMAADVPAFCLGEKLNITVWAENMGKRKGTCVVQFYIRDKKASVTRPKAELKYFERVKLEAGERKRLTFQVEEEMLRFTRIDGSYGSEPGLFEAMAGENAWNWLSCTFMLKEKD